MKNKERTPKPSRRSQRRKKARKVKAIVVKDPETNAPSPRTEVMRKTKPTVAGAPKTTTNDQNQAEAGKAREIPSRSRRMTNARKTGANAVKRTTLSKSNRVETGKALEGTKNIHITVRNSVPNHAEAGFI